MSNQRQVRVRFAPSPTGYLHVGGARTALFNWLYARSQGGAFVLRIEDTDQQRSSEESYAAILRGLDWLGLDWDEGPRVGGDHGPYLQSERLDLYRAQCDRLIAAEQVYRCFCSNDDLTRRADEAKARGDSWDGYDGHCRDLSAQQQAELEAEGRPHCWRLRTPEEGTTFWYDLIVGKREFQNAVLVDRVVFKADGFPTYNFAVVVDDHEMAMTHVLRGDDHVSNTPFQLLIYAACGWDPPKFGHMPMILGPDKKRLSKRHGATSVEEFQDLGIIPDAMVNYLALLGWSIGASGDEVLERRALVKKFSLKKVGSSPAAFDYDKLDHINAQHLKRLGPEQRRELVLPLLVQRDWAYDPAWLVPGVVTTAEYCDRVLKTLGGRFSNLARVPEQIGFFFSENYAVDQEARQAHLASAETAEQLGQLAAKLTDTCDLSQPVSAAGFESGVRDTATELGIEAGALIHACRVALTGQSRSAGIFEVMELVGGPRVLARLRGAVSG